MDKEKRTKSELVMLQSLPLNVKVEKTKQRIREWVDHYGVDKVYVSFSGGKDSTVLLHIVREMYPEIPAVFCDTGLEYPEIREFVKQFENVVWLKPKMNFKKVIVEYGYPIISKDISQAVYDVRTQARLYQVHYRQTKLYNRNFDPDGEYSKKYPSYCRAKWAFLLDADFKITHKCCDVMKKDPAKKYEKQTGRTPILATMASESRIRQTQWMKDGCNAFDSNRPKSKPMSFWLENDVLQYIKQNGLQICSVYGEIIEDGECVGQTCLNEYMGFNVEQQKLKTTKCSRTGCMYCMFGCSSKDWDNFVRIRETHPKYYEYIMRPINEGGLGFKHVVDWLNEHGGLDIKY